MSTLSNLDIKIYADGADKAEMLEMAKREYIQGLTTNPTLMKKAGVKDYVSFCKDILSEIKELPISFEVFADEFEEMKRQALEIKSWGNNVYVKIPIMNTKKQYSYELINDLTNAGVKLNVTAIFTQKQVEELLKNTEKTKGLVVSVFAGRIADTGVDPVPLMSKCKQLTKNHSDYTELLWASPREVLNIFQANECGCDIITVSGDILNKLKLLGKDLEDFSNETVKMFYNDATSVGYTI
ncbi:MAG: transaldolase [Halobacteriovoraceae bacterium]|nr:transaldolase [Halobacteriovoraceae bacterium]